MQALKALVIFMGILIAVGVTVIGVTIYRRATDTVSQDKVVSVVPVMPSSSGANPGAQPPKASGSAAPAFGVRVLDLPPGSIFVSAQPFDSRVLAHVRLPDGDTRILLLDPATGDIAGEWRTSGGAAEAVQVPTRPQPDGQAVRP